ncbi:MAG TPA: glycosyltransferase family A protein [Rhizomicrobium sp.]|nr:glycosyltransferase family A protein [Rhizomicrobium sp.]
MPEALATVVIPTVGRWSRLALLLKTLIPQLDDSSELVIVVDRDVAVPPGLRSALQDVPHRFLMRTPPHGRSHARNAGIEAAGSATVLLLDEDMLVAPGWLKAHMAAQARAPGLVRGEIRELPPLAAFDDLDTWGGRDESDAVRRRGKRILSMALEDFEGCWARFAVASGLQKLADETRDEASVTWVGFAGANLGAPQRLLLERPFDERAGINWGLEDLTLALRTLRDTGTLTVAEGARALHLTHPQRGWKEQQRANVLLLEVLAPPLRAPALALIEEAGAAPQLQVWRAEVARHGGLFDA